MNKPIQLILVLLLLSSCANQSGESLDYFIAKTAFSTPNCAPETSSCLMVTIEYPRFNQGDSLAKFLANRIIKNSILDNIGMGDVEATVELGIEEAVEELNKNFEEIKKDFVGYSTGWQADIKTKEMYKSDSFMVLSMSSMTYFGGAHPNRNLRYYNFDRATGRYLPITVFVKDIKEFTTRAEKVFRKTYKIEEEESLTDAGFDFLGGQFVLSANYAFIGDSVKLHYNHYEISSYAAGDFDITVALK